MKTVRCLVGIAALSVAVFGASCGWITGRIDDSEVSELDKGIKAEKRTTVFEQSLKDFGRLLQAYNVPVTTIQSKNIGNETAEKNLPSDLYAMIASSIGKIGPQLKFIPYDAQYLIDESITGGVITRIYPQIVLDGGITGFDKELFDKSREMEAAGGWAGAQGGGRLKASGNYSRLTLDLSLIDYRTQSYFPGVIASNSILLERSTLGWGVYGYYMGNGGAFDYGIALKQGTHAALRTLVEYSIMEVLGKYFEIPYWCCIKGAAPDEDFMARLQTRFLELAKESQQLKIKELLFLHGHNGIDRTSPVFSREEYTMLRNVMNSCQVHSLADLYIELWKTVPVEKAVRRVLIDRRNRSRRDQERLEATRQAEAARAEEAAAEQARQQRDQQEKNAAFHQFVAAGNHYFEGKKYEEALREFTAANQLFAGEAYPAEMIARSRAAMEERRRTAVRYTEQLQAADALFRAAEAADFSFSQYKKALLAYQQLAAVNPADAMLQSRIDLIQKKLEKYTTVHQKTEGW
jgi:tetratricopeptide (TPR) repeat protein